MQVNLTCDHRVIYDADAAAFLKDLAQLIETNPEPGLLMAAISCSRVTSSTFRRRSSPAPSRPCGAVVGA